MPDGGGRLVSSRRRAGRVPLRRRWCVLGDRLDRGDGAVVVHAVRDHASRVLYADALLRLLPRPLPRDQLPHPPPACERILHVPVPHPNNAVHAALVHRLLHGRAVRRAPGVGGDARARHRGQQVYRAEPAARLRRAAVDGPLCVARTVSNRAILASGERPPADFWRLGCCAARRLLLSH